MGLTIRYAARAEKDQIDLLKYVNEHWGREKAHELDLHIEKILSETSEMPNVSSL